jgi:hypothetical protein
MSYHHYRLNRLWERVACVLSWKSGKATWRDDENNPYAPGWYLELRECYLRFKPDCLVVSDTRQVRDSFADTVSANMLNKYGELQLTLCDDISIQRTRHATNNSYAAQSNSSRDDLQEYCEVRLAGSSWGPSCRRL